MAHEFDGKKYAKTSIHQREWGMRLIKELKLRGNEQILDLGCGDGALTALLAEQVPDGQVVGIDASRGMIETATRQSLPNLLFQLKDINDLNYTEEFDLIFSNATLHWVQDHNRLLLNCRRALTPGGMLRFNFAADGNCGTFNELVAELMEDPRFVDSFRQFEWPWYMPALDDYRSLVEKTGWRDIKVWGENLDSYFPSEVDMIGWIDQPSIVPFLRVIEDADKKQAFRDDLVARMVERAKQPDGTCFETFRRINVLARKSK